MPDGSLSWSYPVPGSLIDRFPTLTTWCVVGWCPHIRDVGTLFSPSLLMLALASLGIASRASRDPLGISGAIGCVCVCVCLCVSAHVRVWFGRFRSCSLSRARGRRRLRRLVSVVVTVVLVVVLGPARCGVPWCPRVRSGVAFLVSLVSCRLVYCRIGGRLSCTCIRWLLAKLYLHSLVVG